jgi:hypothetical protein
MKINKILIARLGFVMLAMGSAEAFAKTTYILTVTNGSQMPISPAVVYAQNGQNGKTQVGMVPTAGFVELCQTGNTSTRYQELGMDTATTFKTQTVGLLMPGQSQSVEVKVDNPRYQSVQFEAMYGKTKDTCAAFSVNSLSLYALKKHLVSEIVGKDNVLQTGAFLNPAIPSGTMDVCGSLADAVTCLRGLALPNSNQALVRFFTPYLSGVQMALENKYGASEVQSLIIPSSGAVEFKLKLKH